MMKLSDYVIRFIADLGVRHVFMLPGGGAMHLNDSLGSCPDVEAVCNLHEQASAIAAEAYARVAGTIGVALVTTGPGGTNALTGVAGAWLESTPCLIISGQVKRSDMKGDLGIRQLGLQELDIVSVVKTITKYAVTVTDPSSIRYHLEQALYLARSGRPGPVWIDIPLDVQAVQIDPATLPRFVPPPSAQPGDDQVLCSRASETIGMLNDSQRPVLLAGNGIHVAGAEDDFLHLVDLLGIPVLTTWAGTDLLWDDHPLFFGKPGLLAPRGANFILQNSDCLLSIGARLDFAITGFDQSQFARRARKIVVDVDDAETRKFKIKIDMPVCADARSFIRMILERRESVKALDRSDWLSRCREWKTKYPVVLPEYREQSNYVNSYVFALVLSEELTDDELIVPGSSGGGVDTFWISFKAKRHQRLFSTGALGAMGFGIPAGIGGCLASGRKRTICVDGDGGFQLNIQDLETVARLKLPIKFFVLNNQGYASIRASQMNHFGRLSGADSTSGLTLPDIVKVASAYGIASMRISNQRDLRREIRQVLDSPGPVVCDVMVAPDQPIAPRVSSAMRKDGTMVSRPLEDLWPFLERQEFLSNMIIPPLDDCL